MGKKLKSQEVKEFVNTQTGEVETIVTSKTFSIQTTPENFYFTFIDTISAFIGVKSALEIRLIIYLCTIAEFNTGKISITAGKRIEIQKYLEIDKTYLSTLLKNLKTKGLIKGNRGEFELNPMLFWKGSLNAREKFLNDSGGKLEVKISFGNN